MAAACGDAKRTMPDAGAWFDIPAGSHCLPFPDRSVTFCAHFGGACFEGVCRLYCSGPELSPCATGERVALFPGGVPCVCVPL